MYSNVYLVHEHCIPIFYSPMLINLNIKKHGFEKLTLEVAIRYQDDLEYLFC